MADGAGASGLRVEAVAADLIRVRLRCFVVYLEVGVGVAVDLAVAVGLDVVLDLAVAL